VAKTATSTRLSLSTGATFDALRAIGPGTIPLLAQVLGSRDVNRMKEWLRTRSEIVFWCSSEFIQEYQREPLNALRSWNWYARDAVDAGLLVEMTHEALARLLGEFGPAAASALPALVGALGDLQTPTRAAAAHSLGRIGAGAEGAIPHLVGCLLDTRKVVRTEASIALMAIDPEWASRSDVQPCLDEIARSLGVPGEVGDTAVEVLASVGQSAVPLLRLGLDAQESRVRHRSATALGNIGPSANAALSKLRILAGEDPERWVRQAASAAVRLIDL
jgi:HEAT repeat protein